MAGGAGQRAPPTVSDFLNGMSSGSSGRSSVSLNSLLSDYLQEMRELAEGKLLPLDKAKDPDVKGVSYGPCWLPLSRLTKQGCLQLSPAIRFPKCLHLSKPPMITASQASGREAMALDTASLSDMLMQPMELFPITSCNSWALSGLPTLPSLQKMSIGAAGVCHLHSAKSLLLCMLHVLMSCVYRWQGLQMDNSYGGLSAVAQDTVLRLGKLRP